MATKEEIMTAALEGEMFVSGRHLDNIAPITLGGLVLSRSIDPIDAIPLPVPPAWSVALITPNVRIETKQARAILPPQWDRVGRQVVISGVNHGFDPEVPAFAPP